MRDISRNPKSRMKDFFFNTNIIGCWWSLIKGMSEVK